MNECAHSQKQNRSHLNTPFLCVGKVITQAISAKNMNFANYCVGPAGFRFHLERNEHWKDRRLMGLMWSQVDRVQGDWHQNPVHLSVSLNTEALLKLSSLLFIHFF